jgi:cytochrome b pre-mRNA-processing protein 3
MILSRLFKNQRDDDPSVPLYAQIVAQARRPEFYRDLEVPDTVDGRFDLLMLHAVLFFRRLKGEGEDARELGQRVFDTMFADLDQNIREMGTSDVAVGKKVKKMAAAFYGRAAAYDAALDRCDEAPEALRDALRRNLFPDTEVSRDSLEALARYAVTSVERLKANALAEIFSGEISFADPPRQDVGT